MRPRGSSVALSCRMVSMPTAPTSSCSSCRLPSPMPCSPVHVPWSASARLGTAEKRRSAGHSSHSRQLPPPPWPRLCSCLPSWCAKALTLRSSSASSGSTIRMQWKLPSPTCPTMHPGGPRGQSCCPWPSLPPSPPQLQQRAGRTCEPRGLQVLLGLHQDLRQPGNGNTNVGGIALDRGQACEVLPSPLA